MKKVIILGSRHVGSKNDPAQIAEALQVLRDIQVSVVQFEDLLIDISTQQCTITDTVSNRVLHEADLVICLGWYKHGNLGFYQDIAYTVSLYLQAHKVPFWNSEMLQQRSTTKLSAMALLALNGLPIPRTIFSLNSQELATRADGLGWPCIVKAIAASRGQHNFRVADPTELQSAIQAVSGKPVMLQEYLPNTYDLRVVCVDAQPSLVIKRSRTSDKTHLNNTSQGGVAEVIDVQELPAALADMCKTACALFGRELAGVDIMPFAGAPSQWVFLEVNAIPQLTTGSFVGKKMHVLANRVAQFLDLER